MRLQSMRLENWRSFLGVAEMQFADQKKENITLIVGENGSGKTAFLNAFTWALFGETAAGFRRPTDLFNHAALAAIGPADTAKMEVTIQFEHEGSHFDIKRYQLAERADSAEEPKISETKLVATARRKNGDTDKIEQSDIEKILPHGLHSFFFFPAESIGQELESGDKGKVRANMRTAIDVLLSIEKYDRAVQVVSQALSKHLKTPKGSSSGTAWTDAEVEMEATRTSWEEMSKREKNLPDLINRQIEIVNALEEQLTDQQDHKEAKNEFEKINRKLDQAQNDSTHARSLQSQLINSHACVLFGRELFSDASNVLEKAHKAGEIPPKISDGLLQELIDERENCICGTYLDADGKAHLEKLRSQTVSDGIVETASNLRGRVSKLFLDSGKPLDQITANNLLEYVRQAANADRDVLLLKNQKQELLAQSPEAGAANPTETMESWKGAVSNLEKLKREQEDIAKDLPKLESAKKSAEKKHQKLLEKNTETRSVGQARKYLSNVESVLTDIRDIIRKSARQDVQKAMNKFFQPLLLKNYQIVLTDEFEYQVMDISTGKQIGPASSETALATFAFVGAIASLMPAYANLESLIPAGDGKSPGGINPDLQQAYPVVLDAPYSPFGEKYSERFSAKLPDLLPQSVIIVRNDQIKYLKPMFDTGRVGQAYLLQMHSGKDEERQISWLNQKVSYVVNTRDAESSHTKVVPLSVE